MITDKKPVYKTYQINLPTRPANPVNPGRGEYQDAEDWTEIEFKTRCPDGMDFKEVEIRNLSSNIYTGPGYLMSFEIKRLFNETVYWVDSLQGTFVNHLETANGYKTVDPEYTVRIRRISGPLDPSRLPYYDNADVLQQRHVVPYTANAVICFTLVFYR